MNVLLPAGPSAFSRGRGTGGSGPAGDDGGGPNGPGGPGGPAADGSDGLPDGPSDGGAGWADLDWDRAVDILREADEVSLACHISPDGDALGSMLALAQALRSLGKRCVASFGEPFTVPASLRFLPGQDLLVEPGWPATRK
jgi:phosphoesterase RecJ-like protein